ncbi:MAG: oligosaccharide flippase family protein [Bryobacteraceae bacterium]|nr:oligosaccharide flippase family protein [Bryobacteraceae bacterium]
MKELRNKTVHHLIVVFGGRVTFVALSFVGTSLVLRSLSPAEVGIYWLCLAVIKIVTGCLADSLDLAVLRSVPHNLQADPAHAMETLRAAFWMRLGTVLSLLLVASVAAPGLSELIFKRRDYGHMLVLTGVALAGEMLVRSAMGYFQAAQRFNQLVILDVVAQATRFACVAGLLAGGMLNATSALCAYLAASFLAFAVALPLLPQDLRLVRFPSLHEVREVFQYCKWMVAAMALAALYERLDVMLLGLFRGPEEVSIYAPAVMLATTPELLVSVVLTVVNPQVARLYELGRVQELARQYMKFAIPIALLSIAGALTIGGVVIEALFGARYQLSIPSFKVLAVGTLIAAAITPVYSALLSLVAPARVVGVTAAGLALVLAGGMVVIPRYGAFGAAGLLTFTRLAIALLVILVALPILSRRSKLAAAAA